MQKLKILLPLLSFALFASLKSHAQAPEDHKIEQAVQQTLKYITEKDSAFDPMMAPLAYFVGKKYGLNFCLPYRFLSKKRLGNPDEDFQKKMLNVVYKKQKVKKKQAKKLTGMGRLMYYSFYGTPKKEIDSCRKLLTELTHAPDMPTVYHVALFMQVALDNAYLAEDSLTQALRAIHTERMAKFIDTGEKATDPWIETVAILAYCNPTFVIQPDWIQTILNAQQSSGGWRANPSYGESDHTTFLALWALCAYRKPGLPRTPWSVKNKKQAFKGCPKADKS